jgi:hypothetical protein
MKLIVLIMVSLFTFACKNDLSVDEILNETVNVYGGEAYKNSKIQFEFRGKNYSVIRKNGKFHFERNYIDSLSNIKEYIINKGVYKEIDGSSVNLTQHQKRIISNSINSVVYFASLPYPLLDDAVKSRLLKTNDSEKYYVVEVTFEEEGGGEDFDDRYIYWINKRSFKMDYLAYYFHVNGGGSRFRVVHNERKINGIIITDHDNYNSDELGKQEIEKYLQLYIENKLKKLSEVNLENPSVEL